MEDAFQIPVFLYTVMYTMFSSWIPLMMIIGITIVTVKAIKKLFRTIFH